VLIPQLVAIRPGPATRKLGTSRLTVTEAVPGRGRLTGNSELNGNQFSVSCLPTIHPEEAALHRDGE